MTVYLSSPGSQMHADYLRDMPALVSFAVYAPWVDSYVASFGRVLVDSGAYSELNGGTRIDGAAYRDWHARWADFGVDAIAGLDDIRGDWRKSLRNYERYGGFPTVHDTDPPELLADLLPIAAARGNWLGIGLLPPRSGKERFVRWVCDNVPDALHVHGWALREYTHVARLDSTDSTNWFRDAWQYKNALPFLTPAECVELVVKRYQRWRRVVRDPQQSPDLYAGCE